MKDHVFIYLVVCKMIACDPFIFSETDPEEHPLIHPNSKKSALYAENVVVDFYIDFEPDQWQKFYDCWKKKKYCSDMSGAKVYCHCSFTFANTTYKDAACRPKGNPADWQEEKKPQFIVRFDKWHNDGRFFGVRRIDLEASSEFSAPIRDRIGMWIMRHANIIAPRVNHARVFVNGDLMGIYQNIEVVDHEFLEERFDYPIGNLYENDKGDWSKITNKSQGDYSDINALEDLVIKEPKTGDHSSFYKSLAEIMDVKQVLRLMAGEMVFPTWDNYSNGSWNFYYYNNAGKFIVIPWDLDRILSPYIEIEADPWTYTGHADELHKIRELINTNPEWREEFISNLIEIRDGAFKEAISRVDRVCNQIRPYIEKDPNRYGTMADFDADCAFIKQRIKDRSTFLKQFLGK